MKGDFTLNLSALTEKVLEEAARNAIVDVLGEDWGRSDRDAVGAVVKAKVEFLMKNDVEIVDLLRQRLIDTIQARKK